MSSTPEPDRQPTEDPRPDPARPRSFFGFFIVVVSVIALVMLLGKKTLSDPSKRLSPAQFMAKVEKGLVKKATVQGNRVEGELQEGGEARFFFCTLPPNLLVLGRKKYENDKGEAVDSTMFEYLGAHIPEFRYTESNNALYNFFLQLAPWFLLFAFIYFFFFRRMNAASGGGGVLSFGKSRAKLITEEQVNVSFDDVAGIEEAKEEVQEVIQFLRNPAKFQRLGARIPRGVLLVGSPGTGKTLLAKAIAGEANVPFFSICGSDFVEMFVGVGASRVRDLFKQAKEKSPAIIFLDEIDAVGRRRGAGLGGGHDEREQTLNAILVEMDGFHTDEGVIVIASTNRPDVLDPALSRPGRFDREIVIDMADAKGREEILKVHAKKVKLGSDVDLQSIAKSTPGYSGADLEAVINEGALLAVMLNQDAVTQSDLEEARDKVRWGREKKSRKLTDDDRWVTAVHEAGHAIVGHHLEHVDDLHKVSIIPRGRALGLTMSLPDRDRYHMPRKRLLDHIKMLYGGRVAEQFLCDDIDGGAQNDIERATDTARAMVTRWGMSDALGPINYGQNDETVFLGREVTRTQAMSEATAQLVDEEIRRIIDDCYQAVVGIVGDHKDMIEAVAKGLMTYEVLSGEEVLAILEGRDIGELRAAAEAEAEAAQVAARRRAEEAAPDPAAPEFGPTDSDLESGGEFAY